MLKLRHISKSYGRGKDTVRVLQHFCFELHPGQTIGLTAPSGTGKSTLAQIAALLLKPDKGEVFIDGLLAKGWGWQVSPRLRTQVQLLWQSPRMAVDPRMRLGQIIVEPLRAMGAKHMPGRRRENEAALLESWRLRVGLTADLLDRFPHEVSDGQLQRACLARALIVQPRYLICDEMTAMLDVSTQAALLQVVRDEQKARNIGVLLISHDKALLKHWCSDFVSLPLLDVA